MSSQSIQAPAGAIGPEDVRAIGARIEEAIARAVVGQSEVVRQTLVALLAGGHVLLEGVPGLGKTLLVRTLGQALDLRFSRIQFTPDLMPADCTGTNIIGEDEHGRRAFRFQPGPLFANIVLADEMNRATPKTQSALLEAMQEHTVTVGDATRPLPEPFFVLATQNPLEMEGTYPLPEAQLDRFFFKILVPFPEAEVLRGILQMTIGSAGGCGCGGRRGGAAGGAADCARRPRGHHGGGLRGGAGAGHPPRARRMPARDVRQYVRAGASPRGLQTLVTGAQVWALLDGRFNAAIDDIRAHGPARACGTGSCSTSRRRPTGSAPRR